jgi:hypothetical protein
VIRNKGLELEAAKKFYTLTEFGYSGGNTNGIWQGRRMILRPA